MDPAAKEGIECSGIEATPGVRYIHSNGSVAGNGTKKCVMEFAVVEEWCRGLRRDFASSAREELLGLIAGIIATSLG
jgi:hypothetical protein